MRENNPMSSLISMEAMNNFHHKLKIIYQQNFQSILLGDWHLEQMTIDSFDEQRSIDQLSLFERITKQSLTGLSLLEIGSGIGMTLITARKNFKANAFGIEPGTNEFEGTFALGRDLIAAYGLDPKILTLGVGEQLPYPNAHFDAVISSNVLEHVDNPIQVLAEAIRVLKPGGHLQFIVPNYGSWWEGHYGVLWIPHASRWLAKKYLRLIGRDPSYVDSLQLISHQKMKTWLKEHQKQVAVLDWGQSLWEERVRNLTFTEYSTLGKVKTILKLLHKLRVIDALIAVGKLFHWETPIVLTLRKL